MAGALSPIPPHRNSTCSSLGAWTQAENDARPAGFIPEPVNGFETRGMAI